VSIGAGGDLALALRNAHDGLFTLSIEGLLTLEVRSLAFELEDGVASIVVGGSLQLHVGEPAVEWPEIELDGLRIRSDGRLELSGGWLDLAQPLALDLYAFSMEVSRIGFGTEEDGRRWIGL